MQLRDKPSHESLPMMKTLIQTLVDGVAVLIACLVATWLRFGSGLVSFDKPSPPYILYVHGSILASAILLISLHAARAYAPEQMTRPILGLVLGDLLLLACPYLFRTDPPFSRIVVLLCSVLVPIFVIGGRLLVARIRGNPDASIKDV